MKKTDLLHALQTEIRRHNFNTFVETPKSMAQGGTGVVVPGCSACRKRLNTMAQIHRSHCQRRVAASTG